MKNHYRNSKSGITLIALIITIIVILILVAVTISVAVSSGLFEHAKSATEMWEDKQKNESNIGNGPITINGKEYESIDEYTKEVNEGTTIPGEDITKPGNAELKIGDYIDYIPDTASNYFGLGNTASEKAGSTNNPAEGIPQDTTLKWRILNINQDGSVDIISDKTTESKVYLYGAIGYNNGVYLLNDLCKNLYSNSTLGVTARSVKLIDIEKKINSEWIAKRAEYAHVESGLKYGEGKTYTGDYAYSPELFMHVGQTIEEESKDYYTSPTKDTAEQRTTFDAKQTFYHFMVPNTYIDDSNFYSIIFSGQPQYWLASRFADCYNLHVGFGLRSVNGASIGGSTLRYLGFVEHDAGCAIRPVVTLGANIQISSTGGTADNPRTLSK